jgi:hypothetical protein
MDYSGPVTNDAINGMTLFDHPSNPTHPTHWHVREDGWMGASACLAGPILTTREQPLVLRYLLHAHRGPANHAAATEIFKDFASLQAFVVDKSKVPHEAWSVRRAG